MGQHAPAKPVPGSRAPSWRLVIDEAFFPDEASDIVTKRGLRKNRYNGGGGGLPERPGGVIATGGKLRTTRLDRNPLIVGTLPQGPPEVSPDVIDRLNSTALLEDDANFRMRSPKYEIYAPPGASAAKRLRLTLFFGVQECMRRLGLRHMFGDAARWDAEQDRVLIHVQGIESHWREFKTGGFKHPWGNGITNHVIRKLLGLVGLAAKPWDVKVLAAFSTGFRGLAATLQNFGGDASLLDIRSVERAVFHDCLYSKDEPSPPGDNTFRALTMLDQRTNGNARAVVYDVTEFGTPQTSAGLLGRIGQRFGARLLHINLKNASGAPRAALIALAYARIFDAAIRDGYFESAKTAGTIDPRVLPVPLQNLIAVLPERGMVASTSTPVVPGATPLATWAQAHAADVKGTMNHQQHLQRLLDDADRVLLGTPRPDAGEVAHDAQLFEFGFEHLRAGG